MALLVDGITSTFAELQAYDSGLLETTRSEGVDLAPKNEAAYQQIQLEVKAFLLRHTNRVPLTDSGEPDLRAVSATAGMKQWHALKTLSLVYSDVHGSQPNDRYLRKHTYFEREAKRAADLLFETGIGLVSNPLIQAKQPRVQASGTGPPAATYAVSVAWRNSRGQRGALSSPLTYSAADGEGMSVEAVNPPPNAGSYDVFVGSGSDDMTQQNGPAVQQGEIWNLPLSGLVAGEAPTSGQEPEYYIRHERILRRG